MSQFRVDRSLLLERDPQKVRATMEPLRSIRDVDWRHQAHAIAAGYSSVAEMAIDELIARVGDLADRIDQVQAQIDRLTVAGVPVDRP